MTPCSQTDWWTSRLRPVDGGQATWHPSLPSSVHAKESSCSSD